MNDPTPPDSTPASATPTAAASAWGLWLSVGWVLLLATATIALLTGTTALGDALDVARWFR